MMRVFIVFLCLNFIFIATLNSAPKLSTKDKIATNEKTLATNKNLEEKLNKKLDELARDIVNSEAELKITQEKIDQMQAQVNKLESIAKSADTELQSLKEQNANLIKSQRQIEENMLKAISEKFAYDLIAPQDYVENQESIIANELLASLNTNINAQLSKMAVDYSKTTNLIKSQSKRINDIEFSLQDFRSKQEKLKQLSQKQNEELSKLKNDKESYSEQLAAISTQQLELRATLENLKIIEKDEKAKEEARLKAEQIKAAAKASKKTLTDNEPQNVRKMGSSYQSSAVKKYKGAKTIAPLENFTLKQAFGDYTDPVYKIKIFNESVVLRSTTPDATVKNVLDGKVVFAKDTAVLQKVIIMENTDGIHTIYAHLSKIAPTIKVGSKIKKGYVIGRVERDLTFEVTQKNYHINPMELISAK